MSEAIMRRSVDCGRWKLVTRWSRILGWNHGYMYSCVSNWIWVAANSCERESHMTNEQTINHGSIRS